MHSHEYNSEEQCVLEQYKTVHGILTSLPIDNLYRAHVKCLGKKLEFNGKISYGNHRYCSPTEWWFQAELFQHTRGLGLGELTIDGVMFRLIRQGVIYKEIDQAFLEASLMLAPYQDLRVPPPPKSNHQIVIEAIQKWHNNGERPTYGIY